MLFLAPRSLGSIYILSPILQVKPQAIELEDVLNYINSILAT